MEFNIEKYHLKSSSFFDFISPEKFKQLKSKLIHKEFSKGEVLFREGSYSKGVYIIKRGKVKIFQMNIDGKQSIVYIYKRGDYFGYRPILADEPHPVSAAAMDHVTVTFIPRALFQDLMKCPELINELLLTLSKEFSVWINKMTTFSQYGVKKRVALALLIFQRIYQNDDKNKLVSVSINREDFASFVGVAKETLVRMLRVFKDEDMIKTQGSKIQLLNPSGLLQMVKD